MAARGRKPKPTALKELEGNPGKTLPEPQRAKTAPESPLLPGMAGERGKTRMAAAQQRHGAAGHINRTRPGSVCWILSSLCSLERGRNFSDAARQPCENAERLLAASSASFHCPEQLETDDEHRRTVRIDSLRTQPHHRLLWGICSAR